MMSTINNSISYSSLYMNQQRPQGPKLDTNDDEAIDLQELEDFSTKQAEKFGTTFDAETVMSTYDSNEDGLIDSTEASTLQEENGLNLPSPEELQAGMMARGGNRPQGPPPGARGGVDNITDSNSYSIDALLEALETDETEVSSTEDDTVELLNSLSNSSTSYSAADIAAYDINGDGVIDTSEEVAMKLAEAEALESTPEVAEIFQGPDFSKIMQQAISAYTHSSLDRSSQFDERLA